MLIISNIFDLLFSFFFGSFFSRFATFFSFFQEKDDENKAWRCRAGQCTSVEIKGGGKGGEMSESPMRSRTGTVNLDPQAG